MRASLRWIAPAINLALALLLSAVVVLLVGESPVRALRLLLAGAFGGGEAIGYTLYYATSFAFTGLAVAVAFHAGLFNIGAEGQAYIGGLAVGLVCLAAGAWPTALVVAAATVAAAAAGAAWAFVPGWLQARRGSHVVITTIMFNFIAAALMTHLLVNTLIKPGQQSPETREFAPSAWLPQLHDVARALGWTSAARRSTSRRCFAVAVAVLVWGYLWHTRWGYALRALGLSPTAAVYAGISPARQVIVAMSISGALAGLMSLNEVMGVQHRLILNFVGGAGYVGIAVALMGRNHPAGILLAAILFGALYQGGVGAVLRHARPHPRHGGGHPGADHPRLRRAGARADAAGRGAAPAARRTRDRERALRDAGLARRRHRAGRHASGAGVTGRALRRAFRRRGHRARGQDAGRRVRRGRRRGGHRLGLGGARARASPPRCSWGWSHGFACVTHHGNQVVSGMALNITASGLTAVLGLAWFHEGGQTPLLGAGARFGPIELPGAAAIGAIPGLGPIYRDFLSGHNVLVYLAAAAVPAVAWLVYRTRFGLRLRAVGESPGAVDTAGVSVSATRYQALMMSGVLCGLSGAYLSIAAPRLVHP